MILHKNELCLNEHAVFAVSDSVLCGVTDDVSSFWEGKSGKLTGADTGSDEHSV